MEECAPTLQCPAEIVEGTDSKKTSQALHNTLSTFDEIAISCEKLSESVQQLLSKDSSWLNTDEGISILGVKNNLLLQYLTNLVFVILQKCSGKPIEKSAAIDRLIELRTVLERIRPLEQKLKYQVDKLVKIAITGAPSADDATQFRANPSNLMDNSDSSDADDEENENKSSGANELNNKDGLYVPPRLAAVKYDRDETFATRQKELIEKAKKRALSSSIVRELQEEYMDAPTEIAHGSGLKRTISKQERERTEYEETYYTRLPTTKKERMRAKQMAALTSSSLGDELTKFDDIRALGEEFVLSDKKKKKISGKKSGKRKKKVSFKKSKRFRK